MRGTRKKNDGIQLKDSGVGRGRRGRNLDFAHFGRRHGILFGVALLALSALSAAQALDLSNTMVVDIIRSDSGSTTLLREYIVLNSSISPLSGSPVPPPEGTRGQMIPYNPCDPLVGGLRPTVFGDLKWLAFVNGLSSPNCSIDQRMETIVGDPAISAAVFYDSRFPNMTQDDWVPAKYANSNIPFYWMDGGLGADYNDLLNRVYASYPPGTYVGPTTVLIIGTLFGTVVSIPSQSTYKQSLFIAGIVVVGVMLMGFAYFMWRSRKRGWWTTSSAPTVDLELLQRTLANAQAAAANAPKPAVLTKAQLDMLPMKTFDETPAPRNSMDGRKSIDARKSLDAASALALASASSPAPTTPSPLSATTALAAPSSCPICLDPPSLLPIRFLPCSHAFHAQCVDVWLIEKSAMCPLCRADCRPEGERGGALEDIEDETAAQESGEGVEVDVDTPSVAVTVTPPAEPAEPQGNVFTRMFRRSEPAPASGSSAV